MLLADNEFTVVFCSYVSAITCTYNVYCVMIQSVEITMLSIWMPFSI